MRVYEPARNIYLFFFLRIGTDILYSALPAPPARPPNPNGFQAPSPLHPPLRLLLPRTPLPLHVLLPHCTAFMPPRPPLLQEYQAPQPRPPLHLPRYVHRRLRERRSAQSRSSG